MSVLNIKGVVKNISDKTTIYTPLVEVIVNAIQAIKSKQEQNGEIVITVKRSRQSSLDDIANIENFEITDNGIGFTADNKLSFDTLYSDKKILEGGKGFGRFICLKYFENVYVESIYEEKNVFKKISFTMGKSNAIIENEKIEDLLDIPKTGSTIKLLGIKNPKLLEGAKKIELLAKNLVEKILPYFISRDFTCPKISITDGQDIIVLNNYINSFNGIKEIDIKKNDFSLEDELETFFSVKIFKFYTPKNQKSRIALVAHQREVTTAFVDKYIPEFVDEFKDSEGNFIIKAYIFSDYLDNNVSLERGTFEFKEENDILFDTLIIQKIESGALEIIKSVVNHEVILRQEEKKERIAKYIDEQAPWYKNILHKIDLSDFRYHATAQEIELKLHEKKFEQEVLIKKEVTKLLSSNGENLRNNAARLVNQVSDTSKSELAYYISLRKTILDFFKKSLELDDDGKYHSEGFVHNIIFPKKGNSQKTAFEDHNLWIVDERLNFTTYISSDLPLNDSKSDRPDLLIYNNRVSFRGENEPSNPITIFEFKKPNRDDFVNPSSSDDPIKQIIRYVNKIRKGEFKTPEGRQIRIGLNTPFYGYVICELNQKVEEWLEEEKNFKRMPDGLGWFYFQENINLYIEVLSWDKVLRDAEMRNKIFFRKLGLE